MSRGVFDYWRPRERATFAWTQVMVLARHSRRSWHRPDGVVTFMIVGGSFAMRIARSFARATVLGGALALTLATSVFAHECYVANVSPTGALAKAEHSH